jgi:hypothetical protein
MPRSTHNSTTLRTLLWEGGLVEINLQDDEGALRSYQVSFFDPAFLRLQRKGVSIGSTLRAESLHPSYRASKQSWKMS